MEKIVAIELPFLSSELASAPTLRDTGSEVLLEFGWPGDGVGLFQVCFSKPRSVRRLADAYCGKWEIEGLEDTVCEILDSTWVAELAARTPLDYPHKWVTRHFMVRIDGLGCIEVISADVFVKAVSVLSS